MRVNAYKRPATSATSQQTWQKAVLSLDELCGYSGSKDSSLIAFLDCDEISPQDRQGTHKRLSAALNIPPLYWTKLCQEASGFFWATDGSDQPGQSTTNHAPFNATCFRFLIKHGRSSTNSYRWDKLGFASYWSPQRGLVMLCFDIPAGVEKRIGETLLADDTARYGQGPFSLHAALMAPIVESFDRALWSWRNVVRDLEKTRGFEDPSGKRSFENMHETARHVIHCSEMLMTAISVAESIVKEISGLSGPQRDPGCSAIVKDLEFSVSLLTALRNRSQALEKRLENEALHLNAKHDSQVNINIAELARRDSEVMKGITILGMVFLPGTFVSAIFSMSFFGLSDSQGDGPETWGLSDQFWLYWVVALPLTALTFVTWYYWDRARAPRAATEPLTTSTV